MARMAAEWRNGRMAYGMVEWRMEWQNGGRMEEWLNGKNGGGMAEWSNGEDGRMVDGMVKFWRNGQMAVMATRMAGMSTYLLFYGTCRGRH